VGFFKRSARIHTKELHNRGVIAHPLYTIAVSIIYISYSLNEDAIFPLDSLCLVSIYSIFNSLLLIYQAHDGLSIRR
jgi:hypothetical protein